MKIITEYDDLLQFKIEYKSLTGMEVPISYLSASKVYALYKSNKMIGGFILGNRREFRTVNCFVSEVNQSSVNARLGKQNQYCEVCCFWLAYKYRKNVFRSSIFWFTMAKKVRKQSKPFILYGTNSLGLAKIYAIPKKAHLIHEDKINSRRTFVFLARRSDILLGVLQTILSRVTKRSTSNSSTIISTNYKTLMHEISQ